MPTSANSVKISLKGPQARPMLWVKVSNPHTGAAVISLAIVDTGADACAFPAKAAFQLGHDLEPVSPKEVSTAKGKTFAHPHTTRVDILAIRPDGRPGDKVLYTIPNTLIDFTKGLDAFILGTKNFLSKFILKIDYPRQALSLRLPQVEKRKKKKKQRKH